MVKGCAVPKCKTGYQSFKQKCSVFRVPRNVEQYKKWLDAIPGLKQSQYVCEKHFEGQCILRHWRKKDADGRIIAEVAYIHPKLSEFAVPTIFKEDAQLVQQSTGSAMKQDGRITVPPPTVVIDAESADNTLDEGLSSERSVQQEDVSSQSSTVLETEITPEEEFLPPRESFDQEISLPDEFAGQEHLSSVAIFVTNTEYAAEHATYFEILDTTLNVHSTKVPANLETSHEMTSVSIPKWWAVTGSPTEAEQRIIFSYIVMKEENGVDVPVIAKSVVFNTKKSLHYSVYGRPINAERCTLEISLKDVTQLPGLLEKFKNMNICNGLGAADVLHLPANGAFQDSVGRWHQNDCPLVSKRKRCDHCVKLRKLILKKEMRLEEKRPVIRVYRASNATVEKKLLALQEKSWRERRLKNRAKQRGQLLRQYLSATADEIASTCVKTLEQRHSGLNVLPAQKQRSSK